MITFLGKNTVKAVGIAPLHGASATSNTNDKGDSVGSCQFSIAWVVAVLDLLGPEVVKRNPRFSDHDWQFSFRVLKSMGYTHSIYVRWIKQKTNTSGSPKNR